MSIILIIDNNEGMRLCDRVDRYVSGITDKKKDTFYTDFHETSWTESSGDKEDTNNFRERASSCFGSQDTV